MSSSDLENYKFQLSQVVDALEKDPSNSELLKLKEDLEQVISLFHSLSNVQSSSDAPATSDPIQDNASSVSSSEKIPVKHWEVGQLVLAKYKDGRFYEARIVGKSGDAYQVIYTGYSDVERVLPTDLKDPIVANPTAKGNRSGTEIIVNSAGGAHVDANSGKQQTKKKVSRKERLEKKELEHMERQKAWLSFAQTGGTSKKKKIVGLPKKKSIFSTPDDPNAKVGVMGSGKPMTQFQNRGKHLYQKEDI